jgi:predicted MFS family arabinose efflux permease
MGLLAAMGPLALVAVSPAAGVWADRLRRRPIMIAADIGRALLLFTIPLSAWLGSLRMAQLYAVALAAGVLTVFFDVAYQSYLPSLVERDQILECNSKLALSDATAEIVGPGLTGFLVQLITAPAAILLDALSFLWSAACVWSIRKPEPLPQTVQSGRVRHELSEGLRFLAEEPVLRALGARAATGGVFAGFFYSLYTLYCLRELNMSPAVFGITVALGGVGNLLGSLAARPAARAIGSGRTLVGAALLTGVAVWLVPLAREWYAVAFMAAAQLVGDAGWAAYAIHEVTLRQSVTPEKLLGRINAAMNLLARGTLPFGAILGGLLAEWIGIRATLAVSCAGILLSTTWLLLSPLPRR